MFENDYCFWNPPLQSTVWNQNLTKLVKVTKKLPDIWRDISYYSIFSINYILSLCGMNIAKCNKLLMGIIYLLDNNKRVRYEKNVGHHLPYCRTPCTSPGWRLQIEDDTFLRRGLWTSGIFTAYVYGSVSKKHDTVCMVSNRCGESPV